MLGSRTRLRVPDQCSWRVLSSPPRDRVVKSRLVAVGGEAAYWSRIDQFFVAEVLELPGCIAHCDTQEEVLGQAS